MTDYRYAWRNGPRWALWYFRAGHPRVAARRLWTALVHGYIGEGCQDCGRPYLLWHATDDLYGRVTGRWPSPDGESASGLFCLACFDRRAAAKGIMIIWQPEVYPGTSHTHAEVAEQADAEDSNSSGERSPLRVQLPVSAPPIDPAALLDLKP